VRGQYRPTFRAEVSGSVFRQGLRFHDFGVPGIPTLIIHLAAITEIKKTIEDPRLCFEVNCFGNLNMLELARRKNVKRIIVASSANVFGAPKSNPVTEESPFDPRVPNDYSKAVWKV
jgi:nucleoside-diphosphate-sugar epimerase